MALTQDPRNPNVFRGLAMQAVWYVVGALAVVIIIHFDAKLLWRLTPFLYVIGLAVMLALLKYYDTALFASTGSKNWFKFGTLTFQPSELMKIAYILMMAMIITKHNVANKLRSLKTDTMLIGKMFNYSGFSFSFGAKGLWYNACLFGHICRNVFDVGNFMVNLSSHDYLSNYCGWHFDIFCHDRYGSRNFITHRVQELSVCSD